MPFRGVNSSSNSLNPTSTVCFAAGGKDKSFNKIAPFRGMIWFQFSLLMGQQARIVLHESMGAEFDLWRGRLNLSLIFHLSLYQVICECCPWVFHPCAGTALSLHQLPVYISSLTADRESLSWLPRHVKQINLPLMAWLLICSCTVCTVHVHFLSSSSFATLRSILVLHCWIDSVKFLGNKCTAFSSSLISYALKFIQKRVNSALQWEHWWRALALSAAKQACLCYLHAGIHLQTQS